MQLIKQTHALTHTTNSLLSHQITIRQTEGPLR